MGTKHTKSHIGISADQNTAQTYQETVTASFNARISGKEVPVCTENRKGDASSGDTDKKLHNSDQESVLKVDTEVVLTPPLPTLLSPGNAQSEHHMLHCV